MSNSNEIIYRSKSSLSMHIKTIALTTLDNSIISIQDNLKLLYRQIEGKNIETIKIKCNENMFQFEKLIEFLKNKELNND